MLFTLAAALPSWAMTLIVAGITLVVGVLGYVLFRWGMNNKTVARLTLSGASAVFSVLQSVFKDKPDELDAHDFMQALDAFSKAGLDALREKEQGLEFDQLRDNMKERVKQIAESFPQLRDTLGEDIVDKAVDAFFTVIVYIPKVNDVVKK